MSSLTVARIRRQLLAKPGFTRLPVCPHCGQEIAVLRYVEHTHECEKAAQRPAEKKLEAPTAPAGHRLIAVRAGAICQRCRSTDVAWYRAPGHRWALHELVMHPSVTVSGVYLDVDQVHQCPMTTRSFAPTEKQVAYYQRLADSPVFTAEERSRVYEWLAIRATRQTIKDQIDWLKQQVEQRRAPAVGRTA